MKISKGLKEDGVVVGNAYDKYSATNPIVRWIMSGFEDALMSFVTRTNPSTLHEVGRGEG